MSFLSLAIQHRANNWQIGGSSGAAKFILLTTRASVVATDFFDWSTAVGGDGVTALTPLAILSNALAMAVLTATGSTASISVKQQAVSWIGNFTPNDFVLDTNIPGDANIKVVFSLPVTALGANIETRAFKNFNGVVSVYDVANALLATFTVAGVSAFTNDGTAIFIGVRSLVGAVIKRIDFTVSPIERFAINQLDFS